MIVIKRAYEPNSPDDGFRILVDRLWPRGLTKEQVATDLWLKDIAASTELRNWFGHDSQRWEDAKDEIHNEAVVLLDYIKKHT
ncbi:unnamed protein product [Didymodactylos carnosus]|uniref:DUF488 domain-containing protein n=1 Tax=Didymodactylos carnosus TaxID=1234261 RepID=A0A814Y2M5_9BILA|nr:unnamed protein product [Didymodactylos carnosus]CAF3986886.1 unnamed protein product [Didymodactylos carnosus]